MGEFNEEAAIRGRVPSGHSGAGSRSADLEDCARGVGRGKAASGVCGSVRPLKGGSITGCDTNLGGSRGAGSAGVRASYSSPTIASSIHSEKMGERLQGSSEGMKSKVVANQKGGVGKTATSVHLAHDGLERGLRVVFVDLDPQGNASSSLKNFIRPLTSPALFSGTVDIRAALDGSIPDGPCIVVIAGDDALANLEKLEFKDVAPIFKKSLQVFEDMGFDLCIIDTPPTIGNAMASALFAADYVLSPIEPEQFSMDGIKKMNAVISNMRRFNPKLKFLGMVPSMVDFRNPEHKKNLAILYKNYSELLTPAVHLRGSIATAIASGVPVWKIKKTAARQAAKEVRELASYVYEKMEIAQ